ncbi:MAG TPA: hypothetical protein VL119_09295 [Acidimicrobiia bacterium]|nr:hypothetical protein [Acidimicrobiia bacterium]
MLVGLALAVVAACGSSATETPGAPGARSPTTTVDVTTTTVAPSNGGSGY